MDSEGVKKYFKDLLECPVCFQIIDSVPIHQCQNGHVVCKDCHPKMETCPICRDDKPIRNLKLEEIVKRLAAKRFQLPNSENRFSLAEGWHYLTALAFGIISFAVTFALLTLLLDYLIPQYFVTEDLH